MNQKKSLVLLKVSGLSLETSGRFRTKTLPNSPKI